MKLYRSKIYRDKILLIQQLKKAFSIEDGYLPHGFDAVASFDFGDIYVDDKIFQRLNLKVRREIDDCLMRFFREDYGILTQEEQEQNGEIKYFGSGEEMIARYNISIGMIKIVVGQNTIISILQ